MLEFRSMKTFQKFVAVHSHIYSERHFVSRQIYKQRRSAALAEWRAIAA